MNKSSLTNLLAASCLGLGIFLEHDLIRTVGLFALSGALTNWLAVHMLFERVPGLYGSGVVPTHFREFRRGIHHLLMTQFFTKENIERFVGQHSAKIDLQPVIETMDLSPTFDALLTTIQQSSFGSMLGMIGGPQGLEGLRTPFIEQMKKSLIKIADSEQVQGAINDAAAQQNFQGLSDQIAEIIEQRLEELTPELVKNIVQDMIRKHLGWLVVWGGVFGGLIGLASNLAGF